MKRGEDRSWIERLLVLLLPEQDRETIPGDLLEERRAKMQELGPFHAQLWYACQIVSLAPRAMISTWERGPVLSGFCVFTAMCAAWLGAMDLRLRHPGYIGREGIAATIALEALLTLVALGTQTPLLRALSMAGTAGILWLAAKAFYGVLHAQHFEGYIVLIAMALAIQAGLTWMAMLRPRSGEARYSKG